MDDINGSRLATSEEFMFMSSGVIITYHAECRGCDWCALSNQSQQEFAENHVKETGHVADYWSERGATLTPMATKTHKVIR